MSGLLPEILNRLNAIDFYGAFWNSIFYLWLERKSSDSCLVPIIFMAFDDLSRYKNETFRTKWDFLVMRLPVAFYVCQSPWVNKTLLCSRPSIIGWYLGVIGSNLSSDLKSMSNTSHMLIVKFIFIYDQNKKK